MVQKSKSKYPKVRRDNSRKPSPRMLDQVVQDDLSHSVGGRIFRETVLIITIVLAVYLLMALFTYYPEDPGFSYLGNEGKIMNAGGRIGAWISDFFLFSCGYLAFGIPLVMIYQSIHWLRRSNKVSQRWALVWLRLLGFALLMIAGSAITTLYIPAAIYPAGGGGVLGWVISQNLVDLLNIMGAVLILFAILLIGVTWLFSLSWLTVMDWVGKHSWKFLVWVRSQFSALTTPSMPGIWHKLKQKAAWNNHSTGEPINEKSKLDDLDQKLDNREEPIITAITNNLQQPAKANKAIKLESSTGAEKLENRHLKNVPSEVSIKTEKPALIKPHKVKADRQKTLRNFAVTNKGLPSLELLDVTERQHGKGYSAEDLEHLSEQLENKLKDFNIEAKVVAIMPGPVVTRFEIQPAPGVKASRITNLARDLARSLAVMSVRVVEVIPGKTVVGIEIPNQYREMIRLREVLSSKPYHSAKSPLTLALGKDIAGQPIVVDLAKMPHLLVAGTTGSGKSVGLNAMLLSMLLKAAPEELRLIMIDPKMLELSIYDAIPHLLTPVVTDMKDAANALRWCVAEMEQRYQLMAALGVRNIAGFNRKVNDGIKAGKPLLNPLIQKQKSATTAATHTQDIFSALDEVVASAEQPPDVPALETLPYIVVVIDEFADMMMIVGKKVEELIARIAQKARAAGIHLILATQRPSVDVITGLIKANVPARIAFQVSSKIDSRTIIDQGGAEQLLGHGDMLYLPAGSGVLLRVHGAFVDDGEVHRICDDWRARSKPEYVGEVLEGSAAGIAGIDNNNSDSEADPLYDDAVRFVTETRKASISSVQRRLKIGYNRAARMVETMESAGVVSPVQSNGQREVLAPPPPAL